MYRYNKTLPIPYMRQGLIYFWSHNYSSLSDKDKDLIKRICRKAGGDYDDAIMAYMTTSASATEVCMSHYVERSHLYRLVRNYYLVANDYIN